MIPSTCCIHVIIIMILILIHGFARDDWNIEESIKFYEGTIKIDRELGVSGFVCHETHRSRSLFSPWVTRLILEAVPEYGYAAMKGVIGIRANLVTRYTID